VPSEVAALSGLEIRRDGVVLGRGAWNVAVPVDGAEHSIDVTAPGKVAWQGKVVVKAESDAAVLEIPALQVAPAEQERSSQGLRTLDTSPADAGSASRWGALEWAGVGTAGAGVVALGVGGYFLSSALGKKSDSEQDCTGNACGPQGYSQRTSAVSQGNTATILGIAGGALLAGGATLFIVGRVKASRTRTDSDSPPQSATLALAASPASLAAEFSARF